tara:strand:+ start:24830 stop:25024 length:195 start_codon:yes stop_codon:yes gene_type:complete
MPITEITSNGDDYIDNLPESAKKIVLRQNTQDDPITWDQHDNNLELLRVKLNEVIQKINELDTQ